MGIRVRQSHFYISHLAECIVIDFSPVVRRHGPPYARRDYARKKERTRISRQLFGATNDGAELSRW